MNLALSKELAVPIDIVTEALAWIGARGSGKTHGAGKLVELLVGAQVPVVVFDPVGVWYGLRLAKDGKRAGLSIPVFGGLHGDVPLEPTAGALIADLICDKNLSAVIDFSQFDTDAQRCRFVADYIDRMFTRKKKDPSVIHHVFDEAQEVIPQNPQPGEQMMLHRMQRFAKLGRNFGLGVSFLTQRPQDTSKKVLNQCQTVLAFRLTGPQERKAMKEWIAAHDLDESLLEKLPRLPTGNCQVWSPAFLKVNTEVRILPKETFDASATPKFGQHRATRELAPIDIAQLKEAMAATVEKAKAEDPKALRARIAELERAAKSMTVHVGGMAIQKPEPQPKRIEVPVLKEADIKRLEVALEKAVNRLESTLETVLTVGRALAQFKAFRAPAPLSARAPAPPPAPAPRHEHREAVVNVRTLTPPQEKILASLSFLHDIGVNAPPKVQVAIFSGVSPGSGSYSANLAKLKAAGFVTYPMTANVELTAAGRAEVPVCSVPKTSSELHDSVLARVTQPQRAILSQVLAAYPEELEKADVAKQAGVSPGSGSYSANLGYLRGLGLLTYPSTGTVRAADIMFIGEPIAA